MLVDLYDHGGAGSNVWMLADWSDRNLNVNLYLPYADVVRDAPPVKLLADTVDRAPGARS
jgi:hypothetical protein